MTMVAAPWAPGAFASSAVLCCPPIDTAELRRTPHPALVLRAMPQFMGPYPIFYPKYSSKLCFHICSSIFVLWLLSCIHTRPRCIDCKQQGCIVWGNPGSLCKRQHKTENRGNIGPTLVVAFIALDFFFCLDEHWDESLEASLRRERETGLISQSKIFWLRIAGNFYKRICVDFQPRKKYSIDQPAIKSLAENSDKHNHQSL